MRAHGLFNLIGVATAVLCFAGRADASAFLVTLDTSALSGTATLAFGLSNFDAASNTVSLLSFDFGGGSAVAGTDDCTLGGLLSGLGCSGNLTAGVGLEDLDPTLAFFTQQFMPGSSLSFVVTTTNNSAGGVPAHFAMPLSDRPVSPAY